MKDHNMIVAALVSGATTMVYRGTDERLDSAANQISGPYASLVSNLTMYVGTHDVANYLGTPGGVIAACQKPREWWASAGQALGLAAQQNESIWESAQVVIGLVPDELKVLLRLPGDPIKRP